MDLKKYKITEFQDKVEELNISNKNTYDLIRNVDWYL